MPSKLYVLAFVPSVMLAQGARVSTATDTIPNDTAYHVGTLPNGLRYYVRQNAKPAHHAELRLVVRAGSLMEADDDRGVAHFIEHMAFRGTTHAKRNEIVDYLQSIGVSFGADLNAQTSFDNTTYDLSIPTDTAAQVRKGLEIMADWAHGIAFREQDIEEERGIILGERRAGLGVGRRVGDQQMPVLLRGSRYPDRLPIGTLASIEHITRAQLVRFYTTWYRPDRMAIVAVGDFDPAGMEQMIRAAFGEIPAVTAPLADPVFPIPPQPGTLFSVVGDPEVAVSSVTVVYKRPGYPRSTVDAERAGLMRSMFDFMLNERLGEILLEPNAPFLHAGVGHSMLMSPEVGTVQLDVSVADREVVRGLDALLTEVARVDQRGFTAEELDRARGNTRAGIDNFYARRSDRQSGEFVGACIGNFLIGQRMPSAETAAAIARQSLESVTLAALDSQAAFWKANENRVVLVVQPQKPGLAPADTAALLAVWPSVAARALGAYTAGNAGGRGAKDTAGSTLVDPSLTPGAIVSERRYPRVGVTQWTLSNGIVVFIKPTHFEPEEVLIAATKSGGWSVDGDSAYPAAVLAQDIVGVGGAGRFTKLQLSRALTGKTISMSVGVSPLSEWASGQTRTLDLETTLQVLHLMMTAPRYDSDAVVAFEQQARTGLANRSLNPSAVFSDTISATISRHSARAPLPSVALLDDVDPRRAFALYRDRFTDASGFAFMFVGAFNADSLRPLVERYIGSLPDLHRHEQVRDRPAFHPPAGIVRRTVRAGEEQKTQTIIRFVGPYTPPAPGTGDVLGVLVDVLKNRLRNRLREDLAGTYGVDASVSRDGPPISEYALQIQFTAEPSRREELIAATFGVIDSLRRAGPTSAELEQVVAPRLRGMEQARARNDYWLSALDLYVHDRSFVDLVDDAPVKAITPRQLRVAARRYFDLRHYEQFDLLPASASPVGTR